MDSIKIKNILTTAYRKVRGFLEKDRFDVASHEPVKAELKSPLVGSDDEPVESITKIQNILKSAYNQVRRLLEVDRFYVALYDPIKAELEFPLVVDNGKPVETVRPWRPRSYQGNLLLPDWVIEQQKLFIFEDDLRKRLAEENVEYWPNNEPPLSWLGVPMIVKGRVIGVLVAENRHKPRAFGERGVRVLSSIAYPTAMEVEHLRLHEQRNTQLTNLRALNEVGRQLTSKIRLSEQEILELIYNKAALFMNTRNMYIALYDEEQKMLSFPVATYQGKREEWDSREVELDDRSKGGLTEEVIRDKQTLNISNVDEFCKTRNIKPPIPPIPKSWLGVPMMFENRVLGVIALQNDDIENAYGENEQEVLQTMTDQAAVAIENARLYHEAERRRELEEANRQLEEQKKELEKANRKIADSEAALVRGMMAADLVHRLNNLAGTIPVWVDLIREEIAQKTPQMPKITSHLDAIHEDAEELFGAVDQLRYPLREQNVDVAFMLKSMWRQIALQYRDDIDRGKIKIEDNIKKELHLVFALSSALTNALWNVVLNGLEAILSQGEGTLTIKADNYLESSGSKWIKIEIKDTGPGIPEENLDQIFTLYFTTKGEGRGYGLWRTQSFIENLGGEMSVESKVGIGTTFTILLPGADQEE